MPEMLFLKDNDYNDRQINLKSRQLLLLDLRNKEKQNW